MHCCCYKHGSAALCYRLVQQHSLNTNMVQQHGCCYKHGSAAWLQHGRMVQQHLLLQTWLSSIVADTNMVQQHGCCYGCSMVAAWSLLQTWFMIAVTNISAALIQTWLSSMITNMVQQQVTAWLLLQTWFSSMVAVTNMAQQHVLIQTCSMVAVTNMVQQHSVTNIAAWLQHGCCYKHGSAASVTNMVRQQVAVTNMVSAAWCCYKHGSAAWLLYEAAAVLILDSRF